VDLVDKILFDSGSAELSARGKEVLARMGAVLGKVDDKQVQVSGHTDNVPIAEKFPSNWELSVTRAVNVVRFLSETAKVPPKRLMAAGFGSHQPVASNGSPAGRARNRRIEILLIPLLQPAKPPARHASGK
jgi:chemotaxis protein MotB